MAARAFDAVIFDLDGVLTETASVHEKAWGELFHHFLASRGAESGEAQKPFDHQDYVEYVDGKPRYRGVESFLAARGIELPFGDPGDPPERRTVCGLGNRKNELFNELIDRDGVEVYPASVELLRALRGEGLKVGVATSSQNGRKVLAAADLDDEVEVLVDGLVSARLGLSGKPEPDIFVTACEELGAARDRAAVVEDARSGVQAAAAGGFGLVLGVARHGNDEELLADGADLVVADLAEIDVDGIDEWFRGGLAERLWTIDEHRFAAAEEKTRESLMAVGNGVFCTRGAAEESRAEGVHYPGTYLAGLYDRLESRIAGHTLSHDDLVNCPNWLAVRFRIGDGDWLDLSAAEVVFFHRSLDLRAGVLHRDVVLRDREGRETRVRSARLASMADPRVAALRYRIEALNYHAEVTLRSGLDGGVKNAGVERYRDLASRHLEPVAAGGDGNAVHLAMRTAESEIEIAEAARTRFLAAADGAELGGAEAVTDGEAVFSQITVEASPGTAIEAEKLVAITTSRQGPDPLPRARATVARLTGFDDVAAASRAAWSALWEEVDVAVDGDRRTQQLLRFNIFHLLITAGPHHPGLDAGIPARGLHGEGYRGHVFWDEAFILPWYCLHLPATARAVLGYRHRRLEAARRAAREQGLDGAMFPWQSASDGREETPEVHLNPSSGTWGPDHSRLQRHVSLAVAYNVWLYARVTGDSAFLAGEGGELMLEIARFWAGKAELDEAAGRYSIAGVMGPDEFHEAYEGAAETGLRDNAYTNVMVAWLLAKALEILDLVGSERSRELRRKLGLDSSELARWRDVGSRLRVPVAGAGVLEQFDGFSRLRELDWDRYRERYGKVGRMDRILKAEGDSPDRYQVLKQADVLMLFYLLPEGEVAAILDRLGVGRPPDLLRRNFDHYLPRTSHGSTLSALVHGVLAWRSGERRLGWKLFRETLEADYADIQGGTTGEGIHTGAMAGAVLWVLAVFAGVEWRRSRLAIRPDLPSHWRRMSCRFRFRGGRWRLEVTREKIRVELAEADGPREVEVVGGAIWLAPGEAREVTVRRRRRSRSSA